ncbi:MAG: hypothetical protein IJ620_04905 [Bacteroidales bacterium]|nr:hypothetical protein [Bacteroidales bacterium]
MPAIKSFWSRYKGFLLALLFSIVLWGASYMSEEHPFDHSVRIKWTGFDTVRYVMVSSDSMLHFTITSTGFAAMGHSMALKGSSLVLTATSDTTVYASDCTRLIVSQMSLRGVSAIECRQSSLSLQLRQRMRRAFRPEISNVQLSFVDQYGLAGPPVVRPDTVWLYGSESSLAQIDCLRTRPTTISNISATSVHTVALDPVWNRYRDIRTSTTTVDIEVPTAVYSERSLLLPVAVEGVPAGTRLRIYPEQASVSLWLADPSVHHLATDMLRLSVDYSLSDPSSDKMKIRVSAFPDFVRVKEVVPDEVSFVVIK